MTAIRARLEGARGFLTIGNAEHVVSRRELAAAGIAIATAFASESETAAVVALALRCTVCGQPPLDGRTEGAPCERALVTGAPLCKGRVTTGGL